MDSGLHCFEEEELRRAPLGEFQGSRRGAGSLFLPAEGTFDINSVVAGILVLTAFAPVLNGLTGAWSPPVVKCHSIRMRSTCL